METTPLRRSALHHTYWSQGHEVLVSLKPTRQDPGAQCQVSKLTSGNSLVVHQVSIHLSVQGTQVQSLVWEDPTGCGATKSECYTYWSACTESPQHAPQQQNWSRHNEKPWHARELESSLLMQQLDTAWEQQRRPSTAKDKIKIKTKQNKNNNKTNKWFML